MDVRQLCDLRFQVVGFLQAQLGQLREAGPSDAREIDRPSQRDQRLVRADIGRGLLASNVLLARLEGENERPLPVPVGGLAHDPAGHTADEILSRGHESERRATVGDLDSQRLPVADGDVEAGLAGRLEDSERDRIYDRDCDAPRVFRDRIQVLDAAVPVRVLHDQAGRVLRGAAKVVEVGASVPGPGLVEFDPEGPEVRLHDFPVVRLDGGGNRHSIPVGVVQRDCDGFGAGGGSLVVRGVRDVESCDVADHRLVFEDGLQRPLARLRLVGRVAGERFTAHLELLHRGGDVMIVESAAEEAAARFERGVFPSELHEVFEELRLRERRGKVERSRPPHGFRNVSKQLIDGVRADSLKHLADVVGCILDVIHLEPAG